MAIAFVVRLNQKVKSHQQCKHSKLFNASEIYENGLAFGSQPQVDI